MPNRLAGALSPYLAQHASNPVDWRPWDAAALRQAAAQRKPIFLSIGYSSCHWCHVMARDSFEDARIASMLNERFVPVKVDREERPDLDQLYMEAVQAMTGQGGWPLSVFLTPELEPFFGGTFWPARARGGMPGFDEVLEAVSAAWTDQREAIRRQAGAVARLLAENQPDTESPPGASPEQLEEQPIAKAVESLGALFDARHGGFGGAPKFPQPALVRLLLRRWRRTADGALLEMATTTLDRMAAGGMYDQIGGGFHRYAVDAAWLVPHFEKMLYDNAQLALLYVEAWQATGREAYRRVAIETFDYLLADMRLPGGAFAASEDADSEHEEGLFYLWTPAQIAEALGADAAATFCRAYDISEAGNFEGRNIPRLARPLELTARMLGRPLDALEAELAESRRRLRAARGARVRPARDDKVIVAWNALAIEALASASIALGDPAYARAATEAASFVLDTLTDSDGRLLHYWRGAPADVPGFLDDYAAMIVALVALWRAAGEPRWAAVAETLAGDMLARFADTDGGALYYAAEDHGPLVARKKDLLDGALPSGNALAATALIRLGRAVGRDDLIEAAGRMLAALAPAARRYPTGAGQWFVALDEYLAAADSPPEPEP